MQLQDGLLILDKLYARQIALVTRHWSSKHHPVVQDINLITPEWTDGEARISCDFRLCDKPHDRQTKNDYFWEMLTVAPARGLQPRYVLCDSWYSHLDNLKHLRVWPFPG